MFLILFQKHPQLLAQRVGKIVRKLAQPFSLPLLSHNLIRRKCLTFRRSRPPAAAAELKALDFWAARILLPKGLHLRSKK